jgi:hypothetical protein
MNIDRTTKTMKELLFNVQVHKRVEYRTYFRLSRSLGPLDRRYFLFSLVGISEIRIGHLWSNKKAYYFRYPELMLVFQKNPAFLVIIVYIFSGLLAPVLSFDFASAMNMAHFLVSLLTTEISTRTTGIDAL